MMRPVSALCVVFLGLACSGSGARRAVPLPALPHAVRPVADLSAVSFPGIDNTVDVVFVVGEALSLGGSGLDIGPGSGWAACYSSGDGLEVLCGVTVHDDCNSPSDIQAWFLRGGGYVAALTGRPFYVEGSAGLSLDFVDSEDFPTYFDYYLGLYAKGAMCLRRGPVVVKLGGWLALARAKQWGADEVDLGIAAWFVSLGGTW